MKKLVTNYRYWVLALLGCTAIISLMAVPGDDLSLTAFIAVLIGSKLISLDCIVVHYCLFSVWADRGEIPELSSFDGSL